MKIEITLDRLEEAALCIVHNELDEDEACDYMRAMALECHSEQVEVVE